MTLVTDRLTALSLRMLILASLLGVSGCQDGVSTPSPSPASGVLGEDVARGDGVGAPPPSPTSFYTNTEIEVVIEPADPCGPHEFGYYGDYGDLHEHFIHWTEGGTHLVFDHDDLILVLDIAGAQLREVADVDADYHGSGLYDAYRFVYGFYADVSSDGSRVVYSTCEYMPNEPDPDSGKYSEGYEIAVMNIDGTGRKRLTKNEHFDHYPVWSPDGTQVAIIAFAYTGSIVYESYPEGSANALMKLVIMSADIPEGQTLYSTSRVALYPPVWSPNGQRLAFIANEGEVMPYNRILYTVRSDGSELNRIGETTAVPTWSPGGQELAFANSDDEEAAIYVVRPDGTDLRQIWSSTIDAPHPPITRISWSPDGSELLVVSVGLWVIRPDGSGRRVLGSSNPPIRLYDAVWSPDGSRIAAHGLTTTGGGFRVITMARDGSDVRMLVRPDADGGLSLWDPSRPEPRPETSVDPAPCSAGLVVPEPEAHPGLVQDCEVLMGPRDRLAGSASLNWNANVSIFKWQGVEVEGDPPPVSRCCCFPD